jgi:hypothetical protein
MVQPKLQICVEDKSIEDFFMMSSFIILHPLSKTMKVFYVYFWQAAIIHFLNEFRVRQFL